MRPGVAGTTAVPGPAVPRYGTHSLCEVLPAAVEALAGRPGSLLPWPDSPRGIVVLVVDGLGRRQLDAHPDVAPLLSRLPGPTLDAPFPTTTSTSLTSLGTGRPPGEHGVVGYAMRAPDRDRRLLTLTWGWDHAHPVVDARDDLAPEQVQPLPTVLESAAAAGIAVTRVLHPDFPDSGLTRAALRGGATVTAVGLDVTLRAAVEAAAVRGPALVYAHHGAVDLAGHVHGPGTAAWSEALAEVDHALERLAVDLPDDVAVVVTADHGMVSTPADTFVELRDRPELMAGVRLLAGEPRARQLHVEPGAEADVVAAWREQDAAWRERDAAWREQDAAWRDQDAAWRDQDADDVLVVTRDEAIAAGWFGPVVHERVRRSIGDVLVCPRRPALGWVHADHDPFGGRLAGHHGALTRDEVEVPALVLRRSG